MPEKMLCKPQGAFHGIKNVKNSRFRCLFFSPYAPQKKNMASGAYGLATKMAITVVFDAIIGFELSGLDRADGKYFVGPACGDGGCYVGAPPPPLRRYRQLRCAPKHAFLFYRARKRPISSTTGRQENCHSVCRASTECAAAQRRNAVYQPDTHSKAADASLRASRRAVCSRVTMNSPQTTCAVRRNPFPKTRWTC